MAFKTKNATVSTTPGTAVFTATTTTVIFSMSVVNKNASLARVLNVQHFDDSAASTKNIIINLDLPAEDTYLHDAKIVLEASDELRMDVDAGTDVEVVLGILEVA